MLPWLPLGRTQRKVLAGARPGPSFHTGSRSLNFGSSLNRAWRWSSNGLIFSISFSHNHTYLTLVLQRSVSADIRIPDCSSERVLVLDADRLISVPGPGQLSRFLSLSCESPNHVSYGNDQLSYLYPQRSVTVAKSQSYSAMSRTTGPSFSKHLKFVVVVKFC